MPSDNAANPREIRIGELFIERQYLTCEELDCALERHNQEGGRLGSLLVELGYVSTEELLIVLEERFGIPPANMDNLTILPGVFNIMPFDMMRKYCVIPVANGTKTVFMAMVDPNNLEALNELEFTLGKLIQPVVVPFAQMEVILNHITSLGGELTDPLPVAQILKKSASGTKRKTGSSNPNGMLALLRWLTEESASDLLLTVGVPPCLKKNNEVLRLSSIKLTPLDISNYVNELMTEKRWEEFALSQDIDFGRTVPDLGRFRVNIFKQRNSYSIAVRSVMESIPSLEQLGLPPWVEEFALKKQGLIMITGPTGHGKSTTLAALVNIINEKRKCNIITIEDPIEYHHRHKMSNVNQREVGRDTPSFHQGLRHIFRQSPDVIVIGEMRDPESFAIALQAAETGHLVLTTLHSNFATSAFERTIDIFPIEQQQQIRVQLAENFLLVLNQRLLSAMDGSGRILALEKLVNSIRVKNLIRESKGHQIRSRLRHSNEEFQSLDLSLAKLVVEKRISLEEGNKFCEDMQYFKDLVSSSRFGALTRS